MTIKTLVSFSTQLTFITGNSPNSLAVVDLNKDKRIDVVTTNLESNSISVLLRKSDNSGFNNKLDYLVGSTPVDVFAADLNSDGKLDLAIANKRSDSVSVLLRNTENTGFNAKIDYIVGKSPNALCAADFNNDGKADIATVNSESNTVSVLLQNTTGFKEKVDYVTGLQPSAITTGDFNNDKKIDVVIANGKENTVSVLFGNGKGGFANKIDYAVGLLPSAVCVGDFNGDGKLDFAVANSGGDSVSIFLRNAANSNFEPKIDYASTKPYGIHSADFNNDGRSDLVIANTFSHAISVMLRSDDNSRFDASVEYKTDSYPRSVKTADVNGDGKLDLVTANSGDSNISVLLNNSTTVDSALIPQTPPTGTVTVLGSAIQNQTLTATNNLSDINGLGEISYQWLRNSIPIKGANTPTYQLTENDVGKTIKVEARYNDGATPSVLESVVSNATATVLKGNQVPTGNVTISGEATQGKTITVSNSLVDADGLGTISYQWQRDNVVINNASGENYVLTQADVGKKISVIASYTDGYGTAEQVASLATVKVNNVNDSPTGSVTITGTATQGQTLIASNSLADTDGLGTISYQWLRDKVAINNASGEKYVLTQADVGKKISVIASYTDGYGTAEQVASLATANIMGISAPTPVPTVNHKPTGAILITGTAQEREILSVSSTLEDQDGLGDLHYQWLRTGKVIEQATEAKYTLTKDDVGKKISVKVSYVDGLGTDEFKVSTATKTVLKSPINGEIKTGDSKNNPLVGTSKNDLLQGLAGNDSLDGGLGNDTLEGGLGNDSLIGGRGFDKLTGGAGADKFVFTSIADATLSKLNIETIADFSSKEKDKIDLSKIDANTALSGNQAFSKPVIVKKFAENAFTKAGQLIFASDEGVLYGNVDKDATAEFSIKLSGITKLVATDFVL